jgi:NAD(P)-dependent dehydrogenase (short-subunit alcohol dehydrogenase family)
MAGEFESKVAVVTGGNAGIGRAASLAFAAEGAKVMIAARRQSEGEETVAMIRDAGGEASFVKTDVSSSGDVEAMVRASVDTYGGLDYAFNNAGILGSSFVPTAEFDEQVWDSVIGVNLKGVWLSMKYQIPEMLKRGGGAIVNMSSVAGLMGGTLSVAYGASKHGVIGATKVAAKEYAGKGIRVNAVCPAVIKTQMADDAFLHDEDLSDAMTAMHPLGRIGTPDEVAAAVVWLCSDKASFVTGHALPVDGGLLI